MPDNDNTDSVIEHSWLDVEDWEIALRPYEGNLDAAVMLSINLAILQSHVAEPSLHSEAIEEIDRALRVLFLCTQFPDLCYMLFRKFVAGSLSVEEQELFKEAGRETVNRLFE